MSMKKILIAEDDFFIRDAYKEIFQDNGYDVEVANDGEDAISKIRSRLFDMILLDIMMPKVSGLDVLSQIRSVEGFNKKTPVFFITNVGEQNFIEKAFKTGMDGYIIKSQFTPQQIVDEINKFLAEKADTPQ